MADNKKQHALFIGRFQPFHLGHEWLINNKLKDNVPVLVAIRDVEPDEKNPLPSEVVAEIIEERYASENVSVIIIPDIESVNYGRGVGYQINEFEPPPDIYNISATQIRKEISEGNESWKEKIHPRIQDTIKKHLSAMNQVKTYRFYREDKRWYADIPEWTGSKEELMMVAGADTMLEMIGKNHHEVTLNFSLNSFPGSSELKLLRLGQEEGGGYYMLEKYSEYPNTPINHELWLCDVTKFVFQSNMPEKIHIRKSL